MQKILVIGSTNIDYVVQVKQTPREGETVLGHSLQLLLGGKGANQALAVGKLGGKTTFLTSVGQEKLIQTMKENMGQAGIDCSHFKVVDDQTGAAFIYVNQRGNNSIVVVSGANGHLDTDYIEQKKALIEETDYLLVQMEIGLDCVYKAIEMAFNYGKVIVLNPAPAPESIPDEILKKLDYITPNETELQSITKMPVETESEILAAGKKLVAMGVRNVLVTMGEKGAMWITSENAQVFSGQPVKAVDTTAAGDTFNGALVVGLAEGMTMEEAIGFANVAGGISVSRIGAQSSIPQRTEVDKKWKGITI